MRRLLLLCIPAVLAAAACGSGDKEPRRSGDDTPRSEATESAPSSSGRNQVSGDAKSVLLQSARQSAEVESMRGLFDVEVDFGGFDISMEGDMAFRAPDQMHMTMNMFGQDFEMLVYGSRFYMDMGGGWRSVDLSGSGINLDQFSELWENRGLFDVEELVDAFGDDIERVGDETIDGETFEHYHVNADPEDIGDNLPDGLIDPEMLAQIGSVLETIESDFYIDPDTDLVRRVVVTVGMDLPQGGAGEFSMTMDVLEYNGDVDIPAEPTGAPPLDPSELGDQT